MKVGRLATAEGELSSPPPPPPGPGTRSGDINCCHLRKE
jgi:hypothetical protein